MRPCDVEMNHWNWAIKPVYPLIVEYNLLSVEPWVFLSEWFSPDKGVRDSKENPLLPVFRFESYIYFIVFPYGVGEHVRDLLS